MSWRGEFAFGEVWLAFRGASADNRFHAHAAVQFVAAETALTVVDEGGHEFVGPAWAIRSGVRHCLRPAPALTLVLADPQSRLAVELLATLPQLPVVPLSPSVVPQHTERPVKSKSKKTDQACHQQRSEGPAHVDLMAWTRSVAQAPAEVDAKHR